MDVLHSTIDAAEGEQRAAAMADLVTEGRTTSDVSAFGLDRPGLTDPAYRPHWLI